MIYLVLLRFCFYAAKLGYSRQIFLASRVRWAIQREIENKDCGVFVFTGALDTAWMGRLTTETRFCPQGKVLDWCRRAQRPFPTGAVYSGEVPAKLSADRVHMPLLL